MYSIFFYIGPKMAELEVTGFPTVGHAESAILSERIWFFDQEGYNVHIPLQVKNNSVAVIKVTE